MIKISKFIFLLVIIIILPAARLLAQDNIIPKVDTGDTAWMIVASALVMLMTMPGLALFYGGLVRRKNILNIMMQCFILMGLITLQWVIIGYSLSFSRVQSAISPFIGGLDWFLLHGIGIHDLNPYYGSHSQLAADGVTRIGTIPHLVFVMYQCKFAVITPALIIGAFAERIKFKGFIIFSLLWAFFVYDPVCHWLWSTEGWLYKLGAIDFAGGTVVHINAGIAALVMALMLGRRKDYQPPLVIPPHNIPFVVIGASLLWFGWFGFNAGSGLAADGLAANAFLVTHTSAAAAAFTWAIIEWTLHKKPTIIGISTGVVAGLAAITQAAGYVDIGGSLLIGIASSFFCFIMVAKVKVKYGYDDSLDAFGVHGVAGILGGIATGLLASPAIQNYRGLFYGNPHQLLVQVIAVVVTIIYSAGLTYILFKLVDKLVGLKADKKEESIGLDFTQHGEVAYTNID